MVNIFNKRQFNASRQKQQIKHPKKNPMASKDSTDWVRFSLRILRYSIGEELRYHQKDLYYIDDTWIMVLLDLIENGRTFTKICRYFLVKTDSFSKVGWAVTL